MVQVPEIPLQDDRPLWMPRTRRFNPSDTYRANSNKQCGVPKPRKNPLVTLFTDPKTTVEEADGGVKEHPAKEFIRVLDEATLTFLPESDPEDDPKEKRQ